MKRGAGPRKYLESVGLPIWTEALAGVELGFLWMSPIFPGYGVPRGDGSGVVLVPGFLSTDFYMTQFYGWLRRLGYRPYFSGISFNAECPNLLIRQYLTTAIQSAYKSTARRVHVIGHSLGGTMARAIAAQMPDRIASIITLAAPIHGVAGHAAVLRVAQMVRKKILERHGRKVLPDCYTARCTCDFLLAIRGEFPKSVRQTAIYSKCDGIVDWRVCRTGNRHIDVEVSSTHLGLVCSPLVYQVVGERLAGR